MQSTSHVMPFLVVALLMTGCGIKTEIEYRHSTKAKVLDVSKPTEVGNHHRHEQAEANQTSFRFAVDGRTPDEPQTKQTVELNPAPSTEVRFEPKPVVNLQTGAINIHVGDVHHHTHINTTTVVHAPPPKSPSQVVINLPPPSVTERTTAKDARCERLRREYEAREALWNSLFDRH